VEIKPEKEEFDEVHKEPEAPVSPPTKWKIGWPTRYRWAALIVVIGVVAAAAVVAIWESYIHHAPQPEVTPKGKIASLQQEKSSVVVPPSTEISSNEKTIGEVAPKEKVAPPSPEKVSKTVTSPSPRLEVASKDRMAFPLPDKPSVAVLPFVNMSGDKELGYFSDGLTEEIINALSKVPQIFVIARQSTFFYKGKTVNIRQVAENLGVQYVVEGSVRKSTDAVRVSAQLIDAIKGHHLWSERYDRKMKDFFALQDEITMKILTELRVKLTGDKTAPIYTKGTKNLQAFLKVLEGDGYMRQYNKEANALAIPLYLEAIELDPNYAMAYLRLSRTYTAEAYFRPGEPSEEKLSNAVKLAQKAIELDHSLADAHAALSFAFLTMREHDKAIEVGERAVRLNPNSASALFTLSQSLHYSGRWEEAVPLLRQAIRLNPWVPIFYTYLGTACGQTGRYEEGIAAFKKSLSFAPNDLFANIDLAALYMYAEREDEARAAVAEVMRIDPNFSLERYGKVLPWKELPEKARFFNALHKAGLK
jgi:adenylate cyclase